MVLFLVMIIYMFLIEEMKNKGVVLMINMEILEALNDEIESSTKDLITSQELEASYLYANHSYNDVKRAYHKLKEQEELVINLQKKAIKDFCDLIKHIASLSSDQ
jgi:hypothetical protein